MKPGNTFFMAALAASLIAILAGALHSTSVSATGRGGMSLTDQDDGGVSSNVGFILFSSDRDNPSELGICPTCEEIYVMSPDGSRQTRLTDNDFNDNGPAWSHEAKRVAFQTNRNGYTQIFLMRVDGTEQHLLADTGVNQLGVQLGTQFPSWAPSGEQLCFSTQLRPREIFAVDANGGEDLHGVAWVQWFPELVQGEIRSLNRYRLLRLTNAKGLTAK